MIQEDLKTIATNIIENNIYLTLASAENDKPWVAPLFYAVDATYTFYYISQLDSVHTRQILNNPSISFAIFDSHQKEGTGNGIQGFGNAYQLKDEEIENALKWYHTTFIEMNPETFKEPNPYRFFKIIPKHLYILDPEASTDKRVEVTELLTKDVSR